MVNEKQIIQYLEDANPWWQGAERPNHHAKRGRISGVPAEYGLYKRDGFELIKKDLALRQIQSVVGLRRVGKTVILKQLIGWLIKEQKIDPGHILFFNFEEHLIKLDPDILEKILYGYFKIILGQELSQIRQRLYIFFDEIQYLPLWQGVLKRFYDLNPYLKFVVSGSSSLFIRQKSKESLAGRIFETRIAPLSFKEYLILAEQESLSQLILTEPLTTLSDDRINQLKRDVLPRLNQLNQYYLNYILYGHFPEPVAVRFDQKQLKNYIQDSVLKKILEVDLPKILKVDNPQEFVTIFNILAAETGNILAYQNVAAETSISQATVKKYIDYLSQAFLTRVIYNYSTSFRPKKKFLKKHYIASTNFSYSLFGLDLNTLLATGAIGHLVETQVFNSLANNFERIEFWNKQGEEVDFVIGGRELLEVKYKAKTGQADYKNLIKAMDKFKLKKGFLLCQTDLGVLTMGNKRIVLIPACLIS